MLCPVLVCSLLIYFELKDHDCKCLQTYRCLDHWGQSRKKVKYSNHYCPTSLHSCLGRIKQECAGIQSPLREETGSRRLVRNGAHSVH